MKVLIPTTKTCLYKDQTQVYNQQLVRVLILSSSPSRLINQENQERARTTGFRKPSPEIQRANAVISRASL